MAKTGRKPKYTDASEIENIIEKYFADCRKSERPPTTTGLALALGFSTRKSLLEYQGKPEFVNTITRAKSRVEQYAEERLFDRDGNRGAQFSLQHNFRWRDDEDKSVGSPPVQIVIAPRADNEAD